MIEHGYHSCQTIHQNHSGSHCTPFGLFLWTFSDLYTCQSRCYGFNAHIQSIHGCTVFGLFLKYMTFSDLYTNQSRHYCCSAYTIYRTYQRRLTEVYSLYRGTRIHMHTDQAPVPLAVHGQLHCNQQCCLLGLKLCFWGTDPTAISLQHGLMFMLR